MGFTSEAYKAEFKVRTEADRKFRKDEDIVRAFREKGLGNLLYKLP